MEASVDFTSPVTMEIKYYVRGRAWLGVTVAETWIFDLESKYVQGGRMSEVGVCAKPH